MRVHGRVQAWDGTEATVGKLVALVLLVVVLAVGCASAPEPGSPEELAEPFGEATVTLIGDGQEFELAAYVADTPPLRRQGLMGWESLPEDTGMLFVYDSDSDGGFWMKDTLIPLSIAFANADGRIHTVLDMEPCEADPCPTYEPDAPYRYALEVEQGAFTEIGVVPGWLLETDIEEP